MSVKNVNIRPANSGAPWVRGWSINIFRGIPLSLWEVSEKGTANMCVLRLWELPLALEAWDEECTVGCLGLHESSLGNPCTGYILYIPPNTFCHFEVHRKGLSWWKSHWAELLASLLVSSFPVHGTQEHHRHMFMLSRLLGIALM